MSAKAGQLEIRELLRGLRTAAIGVGIGLAQVVDFYSDGGRANPWRDARIGPLHLSEEDKEALAAFLEALTGEIREGT